MALCSFLLGNEYNQDLDGMIGKFLPPPVFTHAFTARFVELWRQECAKGEDLFAAFADALSPRERAWFDAILVGVGKSQASALSATDILKDFVRARWSERLRRRRGALPAVGDAAAETARVQLSMDLKRLSTARWPDVKMMIRRYLAEANMV